MCVNSVILYLIFFKNKKSVTNGCRATNYATRVNLIVTNILLLQDVYKVNLIQAITLDINNSFYLYTFFYLKQQFKKKIINKFSRLYKKRIKSIFFFNVQKYKKYSNYTHLSLPYYVSNSLSAPLHFLKNYSKFSKLFFLSLDLSIPRISETLYQFNYLLQHYLFKIVGIFFKLKAVNLVKLIMPKDLRLLTNYLRKRTPRQFKFYYFEEIAEIFLITFLVKDIGFLVKWIKKNIEMKSLKLFKNFIHYVYKVIFNIIWPMRKFYNFSGFSLKFSGKFMKGGGRKKKIIYKQGSLSSTTKNLRVVYKTFYIRTISGIIGCKFKLAY